MLDNKNNGFKVFTYVWFGQMVSLLGSGLTAFALGVWVFNKTGSVTEFAMVLLFVRLPAILVAPIAGVLVDRYNRRWAMIFSDSVAGVATLTIFILLITNNLEVWHIYVAMAASSIGEAFQFPAYQASISSLVPKKQLGRANGMVQLADSLSLVVAPLLAGVLLFTIGLKGVIFIDFITFIIALTSLSLVRFPQNKKVNDIPNAPQTKQLNVNEILMGWHYIIKRPGLKGLLFYLAGANFLMGLFTALFTPLILTMSDEKTLGTIMSLSGIGMLLGGLIMSVWGGPKQKINGVIGFFFMSGIFISLMGIKESVWLIGISGLLMMVFLQLGNASSRTIWQVKVDPEVQGRVFSLRKMISTSLMPLAFILAGPLVDHVFNPLMLKDGSLANSIGYLIGVGPGRGIGLMFIIIGILTALGASICYLNPRIRNVEDELPDIIIQDNPIDPSNSKSEVNDTNVKLKKDNTIDEHPAIKG